MYRLQSVYSSEWRLYSVEFGNLPSVTAPNLSATSFITTIAHFGHFEAHSVNIVDILKRTVWISWKLWFAFCAFCEHYVSKLLILCQRFTCVTNFLQGRDAAAYRLHNGGELLSVNEGLQMCHQIHASQCISSAQLLSVNPLRGRILPPTQSWQQCDPLEGTSAFIVNFGLKCIKNAFLFKEGGTHEFRASRRHLVHNNFPLI